ncbi:hypothetical protein [Candidatus Hakubella thermalkaliphila]|nr:hypothetical protein [Candidatus Hakubella thermalkaliphila]
MFLELALLQKGQNLSIWLSGESKSDGKLTQNLVFAGTPELV